MSLEITGLTNELTISNNTLEIIESKPTLSISSSNTLEITQNISTLEVNILTLEISKTDNVLVLSNQQGPQGPQGIQGPTGPAGPAGDDTPQDVTTTYNPDGTLATLTKGGVVRTFAYDGQGRVLTITTDDWVKTFSYNPDGSLDEIIVS